jgi:hypothetical protein
VNTHRKYQDFSIEKIPPPQLNYCEGHRSEWHNKNTFTNSKNVNLLMKNPGFIFKSRENKLIFSVKIIKNKYSPLDIFNLGIFLIKISENDEHEIIYEKVNKCYCPVGLISE